jgi:AraC-like DNA-binding protein
LLAGQISNYFYLQNTGKVAIVAIKLMPAALTQLFGLQMSDYTDKVADLDTIPSINLSLLRDKIIPFISEPVLKETLDAYFMELADTVTYGPINMAVELILKNNGMVQVKEVADAAGVGERQLERLFKRYIGLTPKYYARIIRFNYIFQLIQAKSTTWADIVYQSGFMINRTLSATLRAFTGEDPSAYYFDEKNMANFFLNK